MTKNNKLKQKRVVNDDMLQIKKLAFLLIFVVIVCLGIYFLTEKMLKKETENKKEESIITDVNYDIATIGTMFNRPEENYYVIIYSKEKDSINYDSIIETYKTKDNHKKIYYIDLDKKMNANVLSDTVNKTPNTSDEVRIVKATLYEINNKKVVNCFDDYDKIKEILNK